MSSILTSVIVGMANAKNKTSNQTPSTYRKAKEYRQFKITVKRFYKDVILLITGVFSAAFGLKGFLLPSNFIDGGATGIALLLNETTGFSLSVFLLVINVPFIVLGYSIVGRAFAIKTALAITTLATVVAFVTFPQVTRDPLLVAIFGGFFLGAGIGLSIRGGGVLDGTEVLAIYISRKWGTTIGDIIIIINICVFSAAAYFLSVEAALYSMITYLSASKTLDFIIEGIEEYTAVTIISSHSEEIQEMVIEKLGRGVTIYNGKRGFGKSGHAHDTDIVYCVITRLEISRLKSEIERIDTNAFVVMHALKDVKGGMIKKRPLHQEN